MPAIQRLVGQIREQSRLPTAVRLSPGLWAAAFEEMRADPRVRELYGVPMAADIDQPNFLLLGIPIICDEPRR